MKIHEFLQVRTCRRVTKSVRARGVIPVAGPRLGALWPHNTTFCVAREPWRPKTCTMPVRAGCCARVSGMQNAHACVLVVRAYLLRLGGCVDKHFALHLWIHGCGVGFGPMCYWSCMVRCGAICQSCATVCICVTMFVLVATRLVCGWSRGIFLTGSTLVAASVKAPRIRSKNLVR